MVRVHEVTSKTAGGIILPDAAKKRPTEGVVTAVGPGQTNYDTGYTRPVSVAAGDSVVYGRYDGVEFKINGTSHQIIKDMDVLLKYRGGSSATLENVVCIHDRVLVRSTRAKEPTATAAGIYVAPSSSQSDSSASEEGEVVKVGPGFLTDHGKLIEVTVKPGEHVRFRKYAAEEVQLDGQDYFVVRASDLLAKW
jgi:chaperonin GroES